MFSPTTWRNVLLVIPVLFIILFIVPITESGTCGALNKILYVYLTLKNVYSLP